MLLLIIVMCVIAEKNCKETPLAYVVVVFIIGGILIGGPRPPGPLPGYAYAVGYYLTRLTATLYTATRGGVEDTRLEAKDTKKSEAKDFKMCPRGQGRPRGLHL